VAAYFKALPQHLPQGYDEHNNKYRVKIIRLLTEICTGGPLEHTAGMPTTAANIQFLNVWNCELNTFSASCAKIVNTAFQSIILQVRLRLRKC
jgi:hypothetical protein